MPAPKLAMILLPLQPGKKTRHVALLRHRGGGWYEVECLGAGKRCAAGECVHTANMRYGRVDGRPVKQVPRPTRKA